MNTPLALDALPNYIVGIALAVIRSAQETHEDKNMHTQIKIRSGLLALAIGLVLTVTGCAGDKNESKVVFADCPAAVQKTIIDHAGGSQFPEVEKETKKDGRVVYEAKATKEDGTKIEIKVAADGSLVEFENKAKD